METLDGTQTLGFGRRPARGVPVEVPHLVLALECDRPMALSVRFALDDVNRVEIGRGPARSWTRIPGAALRVDVPDRRMSSLHAVLVRTPEGWVLEDAGSKNGTFVNGVPRTNGPLTDGDRFELGHTVFLFRHTLVALGEEPAVLDASATGIEPAFRTLIPSLARHFADLARLAASGVGVLVLGETGTGKEVVARTLHALSARPGPFVAVNCGALPPTLVESELFGAKRGAYSGSTEDRLGLVRASDKGTLLLDEIGDLPLLPQAALLRVLQEREVMPVGSSKPVPVDIRVIAATHHDVDALVARGRFRADLFARLNGFTLRLPPLRERPEDLGVLIGALLARIAGPEAPITLDPQAARALYRYGWPLNVRELEKCLESAAVLAGGGRIGIEHLPEVVRRPARASDPVYSSQIRPVRSRSDAEARDRLLEQLREHKGNVSAVARAMGKARMQIHRWIHQYGIDIEQYRA